MTSGGQAVANDPLAHALAAAALLAIDPSGLGGAVLRCGHGPDRDAWLAHLRQLLPAGTPQRRMPASTGAAALLGGLDFAASLQAGRPILQQGLLPQADGGLVTVAMAERLPAGTAALVASAMDQGEVVIERDGLASRLPARIGLLALDEGVDDDEQVPAALRERLAFRIEADGVRGIEALALEAGDVTRARERLPRVQVPDAIVQVLCEAATALGVHSMRGPWLALRAARAAAAWDGRDEVSADDAALAARLVLAHRATRLPMPTDAAAADEDAPAEEAPADPAAQSPQPPPAADASGASRDPGHAASALPPPEPPPSSGTGATDTPPAADDGAPDASPQDLGERLIEAAQAAIPPGLLALIAQGAASRARGAGGGRSGALRQGMHRGRPVGARRGEPRGGARLHLLDTLRAAAPWQRLRAQAAESAGRVHVRREDFHVARFKQRATTTTVFVVDASGSSALHRLAEAKGAVELLLADCYVRRDRVAVLGFRGQQAEMLLPPTRSLVRAKRSLAGLPGGGGTPLASALDATRGLVDSLRRAGDTPVVVVLTDGRANIARDGSPGRQRATEDALSAAGALRALGVNSLLLDTGPQPTATAQALASRLGAAYLPLPHADARAMSSAVRLASGQA